MTICLCHGGICESGIRCSWPPYMMHAPGPCLAMPAHVAQIPIDAAHLITLVPQPPERAEPVGPVGTPADQHRAIALWRPAAEEDDGDQELEAAVEEYNCAVDAYSEAPCEASGVSVLCVSRAYVSNASWQWSSCAPKLGVIPPSNCFVPDNKFLERVSLSCCMEPQQLHSQTFTSMLICVKSKCRVT